MDVSGALAADLAILSEALDSADVDITQTLRNLARAAGEAVASFVGLSIQIEIDGRVVRLSAFEDSAGQADVRTSLKTPLPLGGRSAQAHAGSPGISLLLFASSPGAFIDLAADLSWLGVGTALSGEMESGGEGIELDAHVSLASSQGVSPLIDLADLSVVNQAIGVLIGSGVDPDEAKRTLNLDAARNNVDTASAARALLAKLGVAALDPATESGPDAAPKV